MDGLIDGLCVGHFTNTENGAKTGCTVVIAKKGAVGGVDVRGCAPGTRETDLLRPGNLVEKIHAVLLTGGSAFGLDAASGIMSFLEKKHIGFETGVAKVPIVVGAVIYDLFVGNPKIRPDFNAGVAACEDAFQPGPFSHTDTQVGVGAGATVGKLLGPVNAEKSGIGFAQRPAGGANVAALVAVNAYGDIYDKQGNIIRGCKMDGAYVNTVQALTEGDGNAQAGAFPVNTTIGVIMTDAKLTKVQANKLASIGHNGLARAIRPVHTMQDGDTLFALATGLVDGDYAGILAIAPDVVEDAILNAVSEA
ncbi:MAG TPA: P1 family peptidase [Candidatus Lokiarchaeia archaeon]|nr:P1 family peptidase [Candidatus Lokiarchaeia archaeon]